VGPDDGPNNVRPDAGPKAKASVQAASAPCVCSLGPAAPRGMRAPRACQPSHQVSAARGLQPHPN